MMNRWKMAALGTFATVVAGFAAPLPASAELTNTQIVTLRTTYHEVTGVIHDVLVGLQEYSIARAQEDEMGMRSAAAEMVMSLAESKYWVTLLDKQVTATALGDEIDKDVADLSALVTEAFDTVAIVLFTNDLDAINKQLDESANAFNRLSLDLHNVSAALWPRLSPSQ